MNVLFEREIKKLCKDLEWEEVVLVLLGVLDGINGENEVYDDFKMSIEAYKDNKKKKKQNVGMYQQNVGEMSEKHTDGDLISRDYILSKFKEHCDRCGKYKGYNGVMCRCCELDEAIDYVEDAPSAEKNAEWIEVIDEIDSLGNKTWHHECSICGSEDSGWGNYKYCPNCGRRMKGESDGENQI